MWPTTKYNSQSIFKPCLNLVRVTHLTGLPGISYFTCTSIFLSIFAFLFILHAFQTFCFPFTSFSPALSPSCFSSSSSLFFFIFPWPPVHRSLNIDISRRKGPTSAEVFAPDHASTIIITTLEAAPPLSLHFVCSCWLFVVESCWIFFFVLDCLAWLVGLAD